MRLIPKTELLEMVPYTIQHIYRLEKAGKFPKHVRVGENRVAWVHSEVIEWIQHRTEQRQLPTEPKSQHLASRNKRRASESVTEAPNKPDRSVPLTPVASKKQQ